MYIKHQAPVVRKLDNPSHGINSYPADKTVLTKQTMLSAGECYPSFEQPGPDKYM